MLFNSYAYILVFLPLVIAGYFSLARMPHQKAGVIANVFLVGMSLIFYMWWKWTFVWVLLASMAVNFFIGRTLLARHHRGAPVHALRAAGIVANLALLGWFKYADFFITNVNALAGFDWTLLHIALPLGISFFTFTQIAFLVDAGKGEVSDLSPLNYLLFVTYFPHLLAGPIIHHREMMPQFADAATKRLNTDNLARGLMLFSLGLAKKVLIADQIAPWANAGFAAAGTLSTADAWITMLAYTLQLAFDFSGYTDMALGAALMMNIRLPQNFNAPLRAQDLQDFWRRWHMTLSRFLRDYVYIPLGGNRVGTLRMCALLVFVFLVGGLWHGAAWTYVLWGALHGVGLVVLTLWRLASARAGIRLPAIASIALTFVFVVMCFAVFRAASVADALAIWKAALGMGSHGMAPAMPAWATLPRTFDAAVPLFAYAIALLCAFGPVTADAWAGRVSLKARRGAAIGVALGILFAFTLMLVPGATEFIYFIF